MKTYRQQQIEKATSELNQARQQYKQATSKKSKMQADENMSFWSNKLAFFENIKYGAFEDEKA